MRKKQCAIAASLALLAVLLVTMPAAASRNWCFKDPVVQLNGAELQVWIGIPEEYVPHVTGPVEFTFRTPAEVRRDVIFLDDGFNGYGEVVSFANHRGSVDADGRFDVEVQVRVPLNLREVRGMANAREMPMLVIMVQGDTTQSFEITNNGSWMTLSMYGAN